MGARAFASTCAPSPASRGRIRTGALPNNRFGGFEVFRHAIPLTLPRFVCIAFAARKNDDVDDNKGDRSWHSRTHRPPSLFPPTYAFSYSFFGYKRYNDNVVERASDKTGSSWKWNLEEANYSVFPLEICTMVIVAG